MTHCNVGPTDRALRLVVGIVLIGYGTYLAGTTGIIMGVVGLIPLITGLAEDALHILFLKSILAEPIILFNLF